jgi:exonuclease III
MTTRLLVVSLLLASWAAGAEAAHAWVVASWNLQWLLSPHTLHQARLACRQNGRAQIPCDVAWELARSRTDFAAMRRIAERISADVIAVQEVESASLLSVLFPGAAICLSAGPGHQQVGFVVRAGLAHECLPDIRALGTGGRQRHGAQLRLFPGTPAQTLLLAVHLKSGCAVGPLGTGTAACRTLARQLPMVADWLEDAERQGHRALVVGDFNRVAPLPLPVPAPGQREAGPCLVGQTYAAPIDHIVLGVLLHDGNKRARSRRIPFLPEESDRYRLSDHCPIVMDIVS